MASFAPIFANEQNAARLLDLKPAEFRSLVNGGHLPKGREIAPGLIRWEVDQLAKIIRGDAIDGMGGIQW